MGSNKSHYRLLAWRGRTLAIDQWSRETGIPPATIRSRLAAGKSVEATLGTPVDTRFARGGRHKGSMPRPCPPVHKHTTGQARCRWRSQGKEYARYFGTWGTPEASAAYIRFQQEWATGLAEAKSVPGRLSVPTLSDAYLAFADGYYRKAGRPTSEPAVIRAAVGLLLAVASDRTADDFTGDDLRAVQSAGVNLGLSRKTINHYTDRIVRMFGWASSRTGADGRPLVAPPTAAAIQRVERLAPTRTRAQDRAKVTAVPWPTVEATLPHLHARKDRQAVLEAAVRLHHLTGMRSAALLNLTPADVDRSEAEWRYRVRPEFDKNAHRGKPGLEYWLGPKSQAILAPLLAKCPPDRSVFALPPARKGGEWSTLTPNRYRQIIGRACRIAGVPAWNPHRLRHARATAIDRAHRAVEAAAAAEAAAAIGSAPDTAKRHYIDPADDVRRRIARESG